MGKIDSDYLWLHERPRSGGNWRRLALILAIPLLAGAAWFSAAPDSTTSDAQAADGDAASTMLTESAIRYVPINAAPSPTADSARRAARVDARVGVGYAPSAPANAGLAEKNGSRTTPTDTSAPVRIISTANVLPRERQSRADQSRSKPIDATQTASKFGRPALRTASAHVPGSTESFNDDLSDTPSEARVVHRQASDAEPKTRWQNVTVRRGDTLSIAFNRHGLSYIDSLKIAHIPEHGSHFTRGLRTGDHFRVKSDADGNVLALDYSIDPLHTLEVRPKGDAFSSRVVLANVEHRKAFASGLIDTSFYVDALETGLTDRQIMKLVKIFGWDVDFALDIRPGDRFIVVYDELFRDGSKVGNGDILAASFTVGDRNVRAVRYLSDGDNETAYYSPDGRAMKKAFIRTPVDYTRISSGFNLSRKHPILNRIRRHEGTDYAAPSGTPIKATGNGRIVFRGRRGGYGNMIVIRHDSHLSTRYGHMSRFAADFGLGSRVHQGDVIGYVGMTGLATGPHLHYEFRVDGAPKDPETIALPKSMPLPKKYLPDFRRTAAPLLAQLDVLSHTEIASADGVGSVSRD